MSLAEAGSGYQLPPESIAALVDAPLTPQAVLDPKRAWMLEMEPSGLPPVAELARPEARLAGLRIDPAANGQSRQGYYTGLRLRHLADSFERPIEGLPPEPRLGRVRWAPDGRRFAFSTRDENGIALWVAEVENGFAHRLTEPRLNAVFGTPFVWCPDSQTLVCTLVPADRGELPDPSPVPDGPVVQENEGKEAPSRTYQDLLENAHDEVLFAHYATAQLARVTLDGEARPTGERDIVRQVVPAPDGRHLLVDTVHRPFSYLVPHYRFPHRVEIWDMDGRMVHQLADLPLAEEVPIDFDAVPAGPRGFSWRADAPATVCWVEALDGGDPKRPAQARDRLHALAAPFDGEPAELMDLEHRWAGVTWGRPDLALVSERWWKTRWTRTWRLDPSRPDSEPRLLFDRSWEDRYSDPGYPLTCPTPEGTRVLLIRDDRLFLVGDGASPQGDRPFLDRLDLHSGAAERLWRSQAPYYEDPVMLLDASGPGADSLRLLIRRETVTEQPNFFVRELMSGDMRQLTAFPHPTPQLREVHKELIQYERDDGVRLTATLYLPPGKKPEDGPFPTLLWAYPREFKSADAAGQVKDSPHRFVRVHWGSPLYLLVHGYAILDGPTMPIIGEGDQEANDTYVEQLTASARAAVDEAVRRGVAEPGRIAAGGHSYGAFMTANLLAHTDLFRAGIARSGAYNRTLTPFGFQAEERTLWQAPQVYATMAPFMHADKIKTPLLLIHGEADDNSGTFPMQSERFYNALKGHGATARLVVLPHESHGYQGRESVMHMLWEMASWLDRHVGAP